MCRCRYREDSTLAGIATQPTLLESSTGVDDDAQLVGESAPRAGIAVAGGEFGQYLAMGPSASLRFAYEWRPGTSWFAEGGLDRFRSREIIQMTAWGPDIDVRRLVAGVEPELVPEDLPAYAAWSARVRVGGGVAMLESDRFRHAGATEDLVFRSTSPMATVGLSLGYTVGRVITLFAEGGLNWAPVDEDKTLDLWRLAPGYVKPFSSIYGFPYNLGLRVPF